METYAEWKSRNDKASAEYWERKRKEYLAKGGKPISECIARGVDNGYSPYATSTNFSSREVDMYGEFPLTI
jgi:hypothetical protein